MDLTPQDVRDVQFRSKVRGYHEDDVDEFLVQVAATLERLQLRLQAAEERARAQPPAEAAPTEESLTRTLVLAQRTADLALKEAREEAAHLVEEAREEHERLHAESEAIRAQLVEESQEQIRAELAALEGRRDALIRDVAALESFVADQRGRLSDMLRDTLQHLDQGSFSLDPVPNLEVEHDTGAQTSAPSEDELGPASEADDGGPPTEAMEAVNGRDPELDLRDDATSPAGGDADAAPSAHATDDEQHDGAGVDQGDHEDAFLAELRRAVTDDEPLGPRAEDSRPEDAAGDDEEIDFYQRDREASGRFGSRLRRRR